MFIVNLTMKIKKFMQLIPVNSYDDIVQNADDKKFILIFKKGTAHSDCAFNNLSKIEDVKILSVDVNHVRDVHTHFGVNSVPSLVIVKNNKVENIVKGCQTTNYYDQIIHERKISYTTNDGKPQKRVTVYSTPTCTFCNKLKKYFNKHGIKYTDIDVSRNQQAAMEMARKSGQRGVPQTEIDGQIIVGFDTAKLSRLLNIPTE